MYCTLQQLVEQKEWRGQAVKQSEVAMEREHSYVRDMDKNTHSDVNTPKSG